MNHPHQQNQDPPFLEPILQYYNSLPPITRTWFSISLLTTTLHTFDLFSDHDLIFLWDRVQPPHLELWRIITSFTWAGPGTLVDFHVLMLLYAMVVTFSSYEVDPCEAGYGRRRRQDTMSDCIFAFLCCSALVVGSYLLVTETTVLNPILEPFDMDQSDITPVFTRTLMYAIMTLDSFRNPDREMNINFFPVQGRYVPLFHFGFALVMGYSTIEIIHGVLVGGVYLFLIAEDSTLASMMGRKRVIFTPQWMMHLVGEEIGGESFERELEEGANVLHHAAASNDVAVLRRRLEQLDLITSPGANAAVASQFRKKDVNGWQPLHEAARGGHKDVLKLLLEIDDNQQNGQQNNRRRGNRLNVDINARTNNDRGCTALWLAEQNHGVDSDASILLRMNGGVSIGGIFQQDSDDDHDSQSDIVEAEGDT